jgi:hypothetical protein
MMPNRTQLGVEVPRGIEPSGVLRPGGHFSGRAASRIWCAMIFEGEAPDPSECADFQ